MSEFIESAAQACRLAGELQREGLKRARHIEYKGSINLVTDVDRASEQAIVDLLQGKYPQHDILAEEGSGRRKDSEYKWIIDPLDGTTNYAHGYLLFCISIALEYRGEIIGAAVYEPNRDEMFLAEKGSGASLNGEKIRVSQVEDLNRALLVTGFAYNVRETSNNNLNHFENFLMKAQAIRRDGVAAIDLCYVAAGRYDGFWELNLFPWDVAAGALMIQEAGGLVSDFRGGAFDVYAKEMLASNGRLHNSMIETLKKGIMS
ncbi:MAG TPA: inositol monophosphatase [Deltaproteobacteria bacterium]|nr:inositol monophosphatase [Deltaproteobacteria bacterium]